MIFFFFLDIFVQQVRILLRRTAWASQTFYYKVNMNHKLYVVNEDGIVLGIVKLEGTGVSIVSVVAPGCEEIWLSVLSRRCLDLTLDGVRHFPRLLLVRL